MEFEFDDSKSQSNLAKHGINFLDAQQMWDDRDRVEISARTEDEPRFLSIGKIAQNAGPPSLPIEKIEYGLSQSDAREKKR